MNQVQWIRIGFVCVAGLLAVLEWRSAKPSDPHEIVLSIDQQQFIAKQVSSAEANPLSSGNLQQATDTWLREEALYREGLKLGLDKDDLIVRRRVIQKMRFVLEGMTPLPEPTQAQLQTWLEQHPQRYQMGSAVEIEHLFFSRAKREDKALLDATEVYQQLQQKPDQPNLVADPMPIPRQATWFSQYDLDKEVGQMVSQKVFELPVAQWSPPLISALGVHLFRVIQRKPGQAMTVEQAGQRLRADLLAAQRETLTEASEAAVLSTYRIRREVGP